MFSTLRDLDIVRDRILKHPEYSSKLRSELEKAIRIDALGHSIRLEGIGENIKSPSSSIELIKQKRKEYQVAFENAVKAKEYLEKHGINLSTFSCLGNIIDPISNRYSYFRNKEVMFGEFGGVESEKIPYQLENLIFRIENETGLHPLLKAVDTHIDFVRIHPYFDGNGRIGRILQDYLLWDYEYPLPIIYEGDREFYIDLMRLTMRDRLRDTSTVFDPSDSEKLLHKFIASKALDSALEVERKLKERRNYKIILENAQDTAICFTIANKIRTQHSKNERNGATVKINRRCPLKKQKELRVSGDISAKELELILENFKGQGFKDYNIKAIK